LQVGLGYGVHFQGFKPVQEDAFTAAVEVEEKEDAAPETQETLLEAARQVSRAKANKPVLR